MTEAADRHPLVSALRDRMAREDLTQDQVAEGLGVSKRTIQYWLRTDTTPQPRHRSKLREWLEAA